MLVTHAQAEPDELDVVLELLDDAAARLRELGIAQWPESFSRQEGWRLERLRSYLESGETHLFYCAGEPAATVTLTGADPDFAHGWPDGPDAGLCFYRLAVHRKFAGLGLGARIVDWASACAVSGGFEWLRCDVHRRNRGLQRFYEGLGFERVGTVVTVIDGDDGLPYERGSGALFQRPAGAVTV